MTKTKKTAVEWIEQRYFEKISQIKEEKQGSPVRLSKLFKEETADLYEKATWIDGNVKGGCVIDPHFGFHFYEEEDAMAFKLRWEE